jgi:bacterioferritin-associated ferredoxin
VYPGIASRRSRLAAFAAAMHGAHPVRDGWTGWLGGDTVVCRCEEVPARAIDDAVTELAATDTRTVKLLTRAGMGWCQGRMCGEAVARLVAARTGTPLDPYTDLLGGAARPVAVPVPLGVLANDHDSPGGTA